jgi:hypothetical protein
MTYKMGYRRKGEVMHGPREVKLTEQRLEEALRETQTRHLDFAQLVDWVEGRLPEEEARAVGAQVAAGDTATLADVAWLRAFALVSENTVIASPPPEVHETLINRFEAKRWWEGPRWTG